MNYCIIMLESKDRDKQMTIMIENKVHNNITRKQTQGMAGLDIIMNLSSKKSDAKILHDMCEKNSNKQIDGTMIMSCRKYPL